MLQFACRIRLCSSTCRSSLVFSETRESSHGLSVLALVLFFVGWHVGSMRRCYILTLCFLRASELLQRTVFSYYCVLAVCVKPLFGRDKGSERKKRKTKEFQNCQPEIGGRPKFSHGGVLEGPRRGHEMPGSLRPRRGPEVRST